MRFACLILLLIPALAACDPCHTECRDLTDMYETCLLDFDLQWEDLGAPSQEEFRDACFDDRDQRRAAGDDASAFNKSCRETSSELAALSTCEEYAGWLLAIE